MYTSFYGGRDGRPFVITKTFTKVSEMLEAFSGGSNYTEVAFGDHVYINHANRANPEHGRIYRRDPDFNANRYIDSYPEFNFQENKWAIEPSLAYGAFYIGSAVGPAGSAPHLQFVSENEFEALKNLHSTDGKLSELALSGEIELNISDKSLVPGKDGNTFNDSIKIETLSVQDLNNNETMVYANLQVPYLVQDLKVDLQPSNYNGPIVEKTDDGKHPFYQSYTFNLPRTVSMFIPIDMDGDIKNRYVTEQERLEEIKKEMQGANIGAVALPYRRSNKISVEVISL